MFTKKIHPLSCKHLRLANQFNDKKEEDAADKDNRADGKRSSDNTPFHLKPSGIGIHLFDYSMIPRPEQRIEDCRPE